MSLSKIKYKSTIPRALVFVAGVAASLHPALGQPPTGTIETQSSNLVAMSPPETDHDKLQGKWQITSITLQGKVYQRGENLGVWKKTFDKEVLIQGEQFIHAQPGGSKFKLDDTRDPKQINFPDKDGKQNFRGIYTLKGDTLTLCVNGDRTDARRPSEFESKEGTPHVMMTLKKCPVKK